MCGISGIVGEGSQSDHIKLMLARQHHRGPDDHGFYLDREHGAVLGHNRLSIIDLSPAGHQPMTNREGSLWIVFNGEIYNYRELRRELNAYPYGSQTDTEVILAAYEKWGEDCLSHFIGMFSFAIWDAARQTLFAARDRFGVKPFYYEASPSGDHLRFASEIKSLHALGIPRDPDLVSWATYLSCGLYDHSERTFWKGISSLPAGHALRWRRNQGFSLWKWYDLSQRVGSEEDLRTELEVKEEYRALLEENIRLRFRSDVPVGINLSGGLDSALLLGLVQQVQGAESDINVFTFITGDPRYDELPWVSQMLDQTRHPHHVCRLTLEELPLLTAEVQKHQDEPFGGFPTLAYSKVFQRARELGVLVLLDGQGIDEQWAGYDYYASARDSVRKTNAPVGFVQGSKSPGTRPACLLPGFRKLAQPSLPEGRPEDSLRDFQFRDALFTKIPRALRFNDRISMQHSTELREPFLDHRLFELALRQPMSRKIRNGTHKWLVRSIARELLPSAVVDAPKRPVQTPQREWLRGPLKQWAKDCIDAALGFAGGCWLNSEKVRSEWQAYQDRGSDNSFFIWQWISVAQLANNVR
jgi:asparagine synthase (glutamine-hydrolysing)